MTQGTALPGTTMLLILGVVACSAAGQLLLKAGAGSLSGLGGLAFLLAALRDARVLLGIAAWILSTVCWLYVLRVAPLSRAYGLSSLTYAVVPLASMYVFREQVGLPHAIGIVCIVVGVVLVAQAR